MLRAIMHAWRSLALGAFLLTATHSAPANAGCREACAPAIARCVALGFRARFCAREVRWLCRHGSAMCTDSVTLSTTPPACPTTTTTLPGPADVCLGAAGCSAEPSDVVSTVASADALRERLLGVWWDCKAGGSPFGGDAAGIELAADGRWWFLASDAGTLVRQQGFGVAGTYDIIDTSVMNGPGHLQLNLNLNTGSTYIVQWSLSGHPQLLRLDNEGVQSALYSHMPGAPACASAGE